MNKILRLLIIIAFTVQARALQLHKPETVSMGLHTGGAMLLQGYGIGGFITDPFAVANNMSDPGYLGGLSVRIPVIPQVQAGLLAQLSVNEYWGIPDLWEPDTPSSMHTMIAQGFLNVLYTPYLKYKHRAVPYIQVGAGSAYYQVNKGYKFDPVILVKQDGVAVAGNAGLGVLIPLPNRPLTVDIRFQYNYVATGHDLFPVPPVNYETLLNAQMAFTVGLEYDLRLKPAVRSAPGDRDGDGFKDEEDKCPDQAEDPDGFMDDDGCPDPDHDGDGIFNQEDKCPDKAEDLDGFKDEDGCPDLDNDQDGVLDVDDFCENTPPGTPVDEKGCAVQAEPEPVEDGHLDMDSDGVPDGQDKCPAMKEDMDGFEDLDGCPDLDNDQDGKPDKEDGCPNDAEDIDSFKDDDGCPEKDNDDDGVPDEEDKCAGTDDTAGEDTKETRNDYKDDDGCPDEKPKEIKKGKMVLKGVNFKPNSTALTKSSYAVLNKVLISLEAYPEVTVEIQGYTDNQGSRTHNRKLSQKRAESVMRYLVERGIDPRRLRAVGYGPANPVATNKTKAGRARNRRIEFKRND